MDNKEILEGLHNAALEKFSLYIKAVYDLLENKTELNISRREDAEKEWQKAVKEYNNLVSLLEKHSYLKE